MDIERLKELGGVIEEGKKFESEGHMLRWIVGQLKELRKDFGGQYAENEDILISIDDLLSTIKDASVRQ